MEEQKYKDLECVRGYDDFEVKLTNFPWNNFTLQTFERLHKEGRIWSAIINNKTFKDALNIRTYDAFKKRFSYQQLDNRMNLELGEILQCVPVLQFGKSYKVGNVFIKMSYKDPREYIHMGHINSMIAKEKDIPEFLKNPKALLSSFETLNCCCQENNNLKGSRIHIKLKNIKMLTLPENVKKHFEGLKLKNFEAWPSQSQVIKLLDKKFVHQPNYQIINFTFYADISIIGKFPGETSYEKAKVKFENIPFAFCFRKFATTKDGTLKKGKVPKKNDKPMRFTIINIENYFFQPEVIKTKKEYGGKAKKTHGISQYMPPKYVHRPALQHGGQLPYPTMQYGKQLPYPAMQYGGQLPYPAMQYDEQLPYPAMQYGGQLPYPTTHYGGQLPYPAMQYGGESLKQGWNDAIFNPVIDITEKSKQSKKEEEKEKNKGEEDKREGEDTHKWSIDNDYESREMTQGRRGKSDKQNCGCCNIL